MTTHHEAYMAREADWGPNADAWDCPACLQSCRGEPVTADHDCAPAGW